MRLNLSDAVDDLAPAPPPCFTNRIEWLEYLRSAAACQNHKGEPKVIFMVNGEASFNKGFTFCVDCTQVKSYAMSEKGLCNPDHLKALL